MQFRLLIARFRPALGCFVPIRRPVEIDDASVLPRHAGDRAHLFWRKLEIDDGDILPYMRRRAGARDGYHAGLLNVPAQKQLRRCLAVLLRNPLDAGIARPLATPERTIRGE